MDEFDLAVKRRNIEGVKSILKEIELDDASIEAILREYGLE